MCRPPPPEKSQSAKRFADIQTARGRSTGIGAPRARAQRRGPGHSHRWFHEVRGPVILLRATRTRSARIESRGFDSPITPARELRPRPGDTQNKRLWRSPTRIAMRTRRSTAYLRSCNALAALHNAERQDKQSNTDARLAEKCGKIGSECGIFASPDESGAFVCRGRRPRTRWRLHL